MTTLLFLAMGIGLLPNKWRAEMSARSKLCENLAIQLCTVPQDQIADYFSTMSPITIERNPEILSMAIVGTDGQIISATDNHENIVEKINAPHKNSNHVQIPLFIDQTQFASLEICMNSLRSWLINSNFMGYFN